MVGGVEREPSGMQGPTGNPLRGETPSQGAVHLRTEHYLAIPARAGEEVSRREGRGVSPSLGV